MGASGQVGAALCARLRERGWEVVGTHGHVPTPSTLALDIEDIPALAQHFLRESVRKLGATAPRLTPAQVQELQSYDWPGNVRELQNIIERAVIRSRNGQLDFALRPSGPASWHGPRKTVPGAKTAPGSLRDLKQQERAFILDALARTSGKIYGSDGAAALLGLKPTTLSSKVHRMGLKKFVA